MAYSLTWLPAVLRAAGLKVNESFGWQTRGHGDIGWIRGVMLHHTAGRIHANPASLTDLLIKGRPDLPGPLSQLALWEDGAYTMIAAGRGYHAGPGDHPWQGVTNGNGRFIGIEAANTGLGDDPWDPAQMDAYRRGVAAILNHVNAPAIMAVGHKEWAPSRKSDPSFNMNEFRASIMPLVNRKS